MATLRLLPLLSVLWAVLDARVTGDASVSQTGRSRYDGEWGNLHLRTLLSCFFLAAAVASDSEGGWTSLLRELGAALALRVGLAVAILIHEYAHLVAAAAVGSWDRRGGDTSTTITADCDEDSANLKAAVAPSSPLPPVANWSGNTTLSRWLLSLLPLGPWPLPSSLGAHVVLPAPLPRGRRSPLPPRHQLHGQGGPDSSFASAVVRAAGPLASFLVAAAAVALAAASSLTTPGGAGGGPLPPLGAATQDHDSPPWDLHSHSELHLELRLDAFPVPASGLLLGSPFSASSFPYWAEMSWYFAAGAALALLGALASDVAGLPPLPLPASLTSREGRGGRGGGGGPASGGAAVEVFWCGNFGALLAALASSRVDYLAVLQASRGGGG